MLSAATMIGAPLSYAEQFGVDPPVGQLDYPAACKEASGKPALKKLDKPVKVQLQDGYDPLQHLPLKPIEDKSAKITHMVDHITLDGPVDLDTVEPLLLARNYKELPECLRPKADVTFGYVMDCCIWQSGDRWFAANHYVFDQKIDVPLAKGMAHTSGLQIDWGGNVKNGPHAFFRMWVGMRGFHVVNWTMGVQSGELMSADHIDAGYDFLKEAPRTNVNNMQNRWIMKQKNHPSSPVFAWKEWDIRAGLKNLRDTDITAATETEYPLHWNDLADWWRPVMLKYILPHCLSNTVLMLGRPGDAKTPSNFIFWASGCHASTAIACSSQSSRRRFELGRSSISSAWKRGWWSVRIFSTMEISISRMRRS